MPLERDDFRMNRHSALAYCLSMIFFGKPVPTHRVVARGHAFPDHVLANRPEASRVPASRAIVTSLLLILLGVMIVRDILVRRWSTERPPFPGVTRRSL